jgi:sugar phosphate isomerase/epimerase
MPLPPRLPIGIGTTLDYSIPFEHMIPMIARAGFRFITIGGGSVSHSGYDTGQGRDRVRRIVSDAGIGIDSVHAPFGPDCDLSTPDIRIEVPMPAQPVRDAFDEPATTQTGLPEQTAQPATGGTATTTPDLPATRITWRPSPERLAAVARVHDVIDAAAALDAPIAIIHPCDRFPVEQTRSRIQALSASLKELLNYAAQRRVRIALENLPSLVAMQVFDTVLEEYPQLAVCYDTSHARLSGNTFGVLQRYQDRIITTHVSDNLGGSDDHTLPYEGTIEWDEFKYYFNRVTTVQCLMLEVEMRQSRYRDTREFLDQAMRSARRLLAP